MGLDSSRMPIIGCPVSLPLVFGAVNPQRQNVFGVGGRPPCPRQLESLLHDVAVRALDFTSANWPPLADGPLVVQMALKGEKTPLQVRCGKEPTVRWPQAALARRGKAFGSLRAPNLHGQKALGGLKPVPYLFGWLEFLSLRAHRLPWARSGLCTCGFLNMPVSSMKRPRLKPCPRAPRGWKKPASNARWFERVPGLA